MDLVSSKDFVIVLRLIPEEVESIIKEYFKYGKGRMVALEVLRGAGAADVDVRKSEDVLVEAKAAKWVTGGCEKLRGDQRFPFALSLKRMETDSVTDYATVSITLEREQEEGE